MSQPPTPPPDPRTAWGLPPLGTLAPVTRLDAVCTRVLAPNPSPMTLDGTNTYIVGARGSGEAIVVDPGPEDTAHLARVESVLRDADAAVRAVVVTHHHLDHSAAARHWGRRFGADVLAAHPRIAVGAGALLGDGRRIALGGVDVEVVATPGHASDHVSLRLGTGALLTGDHVLGRGTSVVAHPDGDLAAYLTSLQRVLALGPDVLYPGHGPALRDDPTAVLEYYAAHRAYRERQLLAALADGPSTPRQLVERIYAEVDRRVWPAAERSTRAALVLLVARGDVIEEDDDTVRLADGGR